MNKEKRKKEDKQLYIRDVKVTLIFKNLTNNYIENNKIGIMKIILL